MTALPPDDFGLALWALYDAEREARRSRPAPAMPAGGSDDGQVVITDPARYASTALGSAAADLGKLVHGERNSGLNASAFALGRLVGGGLLDFDHVVEFLDERSAEIWPDRDPYNCVGTIHSGLRGGMRQPLVWVQGERTGVDPAVPFDLAAHGLQMPAQTGSADARVEALRGRLLSSADLDQLPPPVSLIDGVLWRDTLAELWGKPGCGKSFLAIDWALSVASGRPWQGIKTEPGRVLYIVGEGLAGVSKRRRAWAMAWATHTTRDADIAWLREAVPMLDAGWVDALCQLVSADRYDLIVVDTVSRAIAGHNENAPETMSALVAAADRIRAAAGGACVLFVHHATKTGETNRGHSALEGAADVRWRLVKDSDGMTLSNDKSKDEAQAASRPLRLRQVDVSDGVTSAVVESHDPRLGEGLGQVLGQVLTLFWDIFGTSGAPGGRFQQATEEAGVSKTSHYRAVKTLMEQGKLLNTGTRQRPFYVVPTPMADAA